MLEHVDTLVNCHNAVTGHAKSQPTQQAQQQVDQAPGFSGRPHADHQRYQHMPSVMTTWRKVTEAAAVTRAALPAPTSLPPLPPGWAVGDTATFQQHTTQQQQQQQQQQPHVTQQELQRAQEPSHSQQQGQGQWQQQQHQAPGLLGAIPVDALSLYSPAALADIEALTGQQLSQLVQPASSGLHHECSAWPFTANEQQGLRHLRSFVWGNAEGAAAVGAPLQSAPLRHFTDTR